MTTTRTTLPTGTGCHICRCTDHFAHEHWEIAFIRPTTGKPYGVPADIKAAAIAICSSYQVKGICDPMWIANQIAMHTGRGDGQSNFHDPIVVDTSTPGPEGL